MKNLEETIHNILHEVAEEKSIKIENLKSKQKLVDLGFVSIDLARIIATLEFKLRVDPFISKVPITSIRTVGDLCAAYSLCFTDDEESDSEPLREQSRKRAERRQGVTAKSRQVRRRKGREG